MNILHLASGDLWAGAEVQLFHLAKGLSKTEDVELTVILLNHGQLENELKKHGVQVQVIDETSLSSLGIFIRLFSLIKIIRPEIIHTHRLKENILGGLCAKLQGIKSIRTVHGATESSNGNASLRSKILDALDKYSGIFLQNKIVAVSSELRHKLLQNYTADKLEIIENCIDIEYVNSKLKIDAVPMPAKNGFDVAFIGRFVNVKRVDRFYEIAKAVVSHPAGKGIHFHMIGDGPLKQDIEQQLRRDGLGKQIHLHGFLANTLPALKQMDLLLFTSDHEGLPMTLLEAMALNVPVISRNLAGIKEALCNGDCGFILNSDNIMDYVDTIISIASNKSEAEARANLAREQIDWKYNITANIAKYMELYKRTISGRSST